MTVEEASFLFGGFVCGIALGMLISRWMLKFRAHRNSRPPSDPAPDRLQQLIDALPTFVAYIGPDFRYRFVNRAYCHFFNRSRADILAQPMIDTVGKDIFDAVHERLQRALKGVAQSFQTQPRSYPKRFFSVRYIPDIGPDGTTRGVFALTEDITQFRRRVKRFENEASRDPLTGLLNRRGLERKIGSFAPAAELTYILIDLDHFKEVNDTHGHPAGDRALMMVADALERAARDRGFAVRYGGDEFVLVLEGTSMQAAEAIAHRLQDEIMKIAEVDRRFVGLNASMGVIGSDAAHLNHALNTADELLLCCKDQGRGIMTMERMKSRPQ